MTTNPTPARGAELAERLIKQDGVQFMLGPYGSGPTKAVAPVTEENKVPMVEGNGASRSLFTNGWRYIFAVLSTSEQYLSSAIDLVAENADKLGKPADQITRRARIRERSLQPGRARRRPRRGQGARHEDRHRRAAAG